MASKKQDKSKAVTKTTKQKNVAMTTKEQANVDRFLEATAAENAQFLKFTKGEWLSGVDEEEIAAGTLMAVNLNGIACGHLKWEDKVVVAESMRPIVEGMFTPRAELGDLDTDLWDVDDKGNPRDAWTRTTTMPCKSLESGEEYIYSTSSKGGIGAVGRLVCKIRAAQRKGQTGVPIVKLDVDDYKHKEFGKTFVPILALINFKSETELMGGDPEFDLDDEIPNL